MTFEEIDKERVRQGRSVYDLSRCAGVAYSTYWFIRKGRVRPRRQTLERYQIALSLPPGKRMERSRGAPGDTLIEIYRTYVRRIAHELGVDPVVVLASDPSQRATSNKDWATAARIRAIAVYCMAEGLKIPRARIADAIGVTRQAAAQMVARISAEEEDPNFQDLLDGIGCLVAVRKAVSGRT